MEIEEIKKQCELISCNPERYDKDDVEIYNTIIYPLVKRVEELEMKNKQLRNKLKEIIQFEERHLATQKAILEME